MKKQWSDPVSERWPNGKEVVIRYDGNGLARVEMRQLVMTVSAEKLVTHYVANVGLGGRMEWQPRTNT